MPYITKQANGDLCNASLYGLLILKGIKASLVVGGGGGDARNGFFENLLNNAPSAFLHVSKLQLTICHKT